MGLREKALDYLEQKKSGTPDSSLALHPDEKQENTITEEKEWDEDNISDIKDSGSVDRESLIYKHVPGQKNFLLEGDLDGTIPTASEFAYQNRIEALLNLVEVIKELGALDDEDELWNTLLFSILGQMGSKKASIFFKQDERLSHKASKGFIIEDEFKLPKRSSIERIIKKDNAIHYLNSLVKEVEGDEKNWLLSLDAELIIPILRYEDIVGFIILGKSVGNKDYNLDELLYLKLLGETLGSLYESIKRIVYVNQQKNIWQEREYKHANFLNFLSALETEADKEKIQEIFLRLIEENYSLAMFALLIKEDNFFKPVLHRGLKTKTMENFDIPITESWVIESRNEKQWYSYIDFKDNIHLTERFSGEDKKIIQTMYVLPMFFRGQLEGLFLLFEVKKPLNDDDLKYLQSILNAYFWHTKSVNLTEKQENQLNSLRQDPLYPLRTLLEEKEELWGKKYIPYSILLIKISNIERLKNLFGENREIKIRSQIRQILEEKISNEDFLAEIFPSQFLLLLKGKTRSDTWQISKAAQKNINKQYPDENARPLLNYRIVDRPENPLPALDVFLFQ
ncbi:MAG: hypothetical protein OEZ13_13720 [Spirochaetia bacterium]|nr:hypothetical protein [Spirochaetia bacterium]